MKKILFVLLLTSSLAWGQNYAVSSISEDLKTKAHAVVRFHSTEFNVKNIGEATNTIRGAITILDEKGDMYSSLVIPYNKFTKVNDMEAHLFDANGKQIKRLKKGDIESISNSSSNTIDDSYYKTATLSSPNYPYTIEFKLEYTTRNMMFYPSWSAYPYNQDEIAVEKSSFKVLTPNGLQLRYKEINMPTKVMMGNDGEKIIHQWEVTNLKAIEDEPLSPDFESVLPQVLTAPTDFKVDEYTGKLTDWGDVAKFIGNLNQNRDKLPEATVQKVKELVKNETNEAQKVKKVYEYLQSNTRYVSIQLGIGGWQTMQAEEVVSKGYGDCKALSNYTMAMLKELGIKSYQVLVKAGENEPDIQTDFPSFQFNHVFVCVPAAKDTLWLECTSQSNPFGYLGTFTSDRHVLMITENGGKLIRTPSYKPADNQLIRIANIQISDGGEGKAKVMTRYTGEQYESHSGVINNLSIEDQKKWIHKQLSLPSVEIQDFKLKENKDKIPSITEELSLSLKNIVTKSGTRLFITPNVLNKFETAPLISNTRKFDFEIAQNFMDTDSVIFELPKGYTPEYLPEPVKIQSKFGVYDANIQLKNEKIIYYRRLTMKKGRYAANIFNEYVDFRKKLLKADKNQVVLVGK